MTEDEAKTKWCPHARVDSTSSNRPNAGDNCDTSAGWPGCIASACSQWRWSEAKRTAAFLEAVQKHMRAQAKPNFNTATQAVFAEKGGQFERTEGQCGLAGAPQC